MQLFIGHPVSETEAFLSEEESWHCIKVLRHKTGDEIAMIDGKGGFYKTTIAEANPKKCVVTIRSKEFSEPSRKYKLHIAIAPTKNIERIEWFVEKAVEIGVDEFSFIICKNSERKVIKIERIHKIVESAVKQSLQRYLPKINDAIDFSAFLKRDHSEYKHIAHCQTAGLPVYTKQFNAPGSHLVLIGPEGDFTINEVKAAKEAGFNEVSLGDNRLRTETAALFACNSFAVLQNL
ncbi:MAG TPA: 16S rRNA (uracil(1498)-N(3))-methyltransferase [Bacteroidia bacterium]